METSKHQNKNTYQKSKTYLTKKLQNNKTNFRGITNQSHIYHLEITFKKP